MSLDIVDIIFSAVFLNVFNLEGKKNMASACVNPKRYWEQK